MSRPILRAEEDSTGGNDEFPRIQRLGVVALVFVAVALCFPTATSASPPRALDASLDKFHAPATVVEPTATAEASAAVADNFRILGHRGFGDKDLNADVWVHGDFAYVGTWSPICSGRGVKIVDVSNLSRPRRIGTLAGRAGTSAEDMVVRSVSTPFFEGDLLVVGHQRCGFDDRALDRQRFGFELWDVTNAHVPVKLSRFGVARGFGGVHELDLFQRGDRVYALLAHPFGEAPDGSSGGDFMIVDVTNPRRPVMRSEWGAVANGLVPSSFWGLGSFGVSFGHSARASADGTKAYVSYWDLGVLTFDITDVSNPVLVSRTRYPATADGDAHSVSEYQGSHAHFLLQNDEDLSARTPAVIRYGPHGLGIASEGAAAAPLWNESGHQVEGRVVLAANQGCRLSDYPATTAGAIAVVRTPFPDSPDDEIPLCREARQERRAAAAGAVAVVHDFISDTVSPQFFDFVEIGIPVLFTDHTTAAGMVGAGRARLQAEEPSFGFLRIFDSATGEQVATFDDAPYVHSLEPSLGGRTIHNNEVLGDRAYASWYANGVIALDLKPLNRPSPGDPEMVGQFVPPPGSGENSSPFAFVWGVAIRESDQTIFVSDVHTGLWIVKPTGKAAP